MSEADGGRKRRTFRWPQEARQLVRGYKESLRTIPENEGMVQRVLITRLVEVTGNPRDACLRFLRQMGVTRKRSYRAWSKPEQQKLLDLVASLPVEEAAKIMRRPPGSVRSMLHRLAGE